METTILLVDDERMIVEVLEAYLLKEGYKVVTSDNGVDALRKADSVKPDLIVLDLMLPDISGEEICRLLRKESDVPILMLTAKSGEDDRINGIVIGADDYVTKPFSPKEVVVRIQAILRRTNKQGQAAPEPQADILTYNQGELVLDLTKKEILFQDTIVNVTPIEYKLLSNMAKYPGRVYSRMDLLEKIQEDGMSYEGYERSIDTHIKNLRKKIEADPRDPKYILTVFGMGYKFGGAADAKNSSR
ncbi:response regulator transcription factor [Bacillus sp. DNRA2]|uniref:response regulator transcription factor n=1 Tax=Bacillus sp. DNRA2 TaxID=2723053 RepID=UPI00145FC645|nr:response regulator transcription factor [Bacillus sp. DNRA2]NMD72050.1 response regulator transcription factor [Bacillus sp. DNRA2]